ncbi:class F sortase [Kitasatospora griseola]|uniref:class F sortase n=1 Tax=Kitasatospora griseola TaxID=2064 RepID=UPI00380CFB33
MLTPGGGQLSGPQGRPVDRGTTLTAGHVHDPAQGNGALYNLSRVRPDAVVETSDAAGNVTRWRVTGLSVVPKSHLPPWGFAGPTGPRKLVIVTCGGPAERDPEHGATCRDNVIATAVPL